MAGCTAYNMRQRGIFQILLSGFCFGFLGLMGKRAFTLGLTPGEFLAYRFLIASVLLGVYFLVRAPRALLIGVAPAVRAFMLGVFGYAVFSSCYFLALRGLSMALTVLLLYTYPIWVTAGARLFFGERLSRLQWGMLPVLLGGLTLLLWGELSARDPWSISYGLLSSVFYAAYILISRRWLRGVAPLPSAFYVILGAGITLGLLHLHLRYVGDEAWLVVTATALLGSIAGIGLFLAGLQKLSGSEASMLSLSEPVTAVLLGVCALGERMSVVQWTGAAVVLAGLFVLARTPRASSA
jgi:DME family drug/metabolite transporter